MPRTCKGFNGGDIAYVSELPSWEDVVQAGCEFNGHPQLCPYRVIHLWIRRGSDEVQVQHELDPVQPATLAGVVGGYWGYACIIFYFLFKQDGRT